MKRSKSDYEIQTVTHALRVLEAFSDREIIGVTQLARDLGLPKNNVFRILATLLQRAYVEQIAETDRYRLGAACLRLGQAFSRTRSLARCARPILSALARSSGESTHVGVLQDLDVVHLLGEQPEQLVTTRLRVGATLPAHCTALGKVLLAAGGPASWEQFDRTHLQHGGLRRRTAATITDRDKFIDQLRAVRSQGFALDLEECQEGLACAAAPVTDASGSVVGAISLSAPAFRASPEALLEKSVPQVVAAAAALSSQLGSASV
jgi:DNA-binding IclR family transcriptional regulator